MKLVAVALAALVLFVGAVPAGADIGWSEEQYTKTFGPGQRGFGKANELGYSIADTRLVVEFNQDNTASVAEVWNLGFDRDKLPKKVLEAGQAAEKGPEIERVEFRAKANMPAAIHEAVVDDVVVRVDVRNELVRRIAFCGKKPTCGWWQRVFGPPCEAKAQCAILDRALGADRTMDEFQDRMERATEKSLRH